MSIIDEKIKQLANDTANSFLLDLLPFPQRNKKKSHIFDKKLTNIK